MQKSLNNPLISQLDVSLNDAVRVIQLLREEPNRQFIEEASQLIARTFVNGNKLLIAGNGGSLCDASHFAEELTGFFRQKRKALPALVLSEPGHLTCVSNDIGFEWVFARGIEAFGKPGDVFIGLTTSGNSKNIIYACQRAKELGLKVILFLGKDGGSLRGEGDLEMIIPFPTTDRIQEAHMTAMHIIIELVEIELFS